jgi:hypothetical protein
MAYVVLIIGSPSAKTPHDGRWLVAWDPNTEAGTLSCTSTDEVREARQFERAGDALDEWKTISSVQPTRPWDGKPNRPLSGLTITLERAHRND